MSLRPATILGGLAVALLSLGCSGADPEGEPLASVGEPIAGGYSDATDTNVVGVYDAVLGYICSGSLIAPNVVLTARHCVAPIQNGANGINCASTTFGANYAPNHFVVTTNADMNIPTGYRTVQKVVTPPQDNHVCGFDQAILILTKPMDPSAATPRTPRVDTQLAVGEQYYAIGYGGTDNNGTGAGDRRRRDNLHVKCVTGCPASELKPKTEFEGDTGICEGDSGGPAVDMQGRVVGVTSRGNKLQCVTPIYGAVFGWGQWIMDTAVSAAQLGGYSPPAWATGYPTDPQYSAPVGDACMQPSDCQSGRCIGDTTGLYCTRLCDQGSCPDGYKCDTTDFADPVCARIPPPQPAPAATSPIVGRSNPALAQSGGCAVRPSADPTKPIPWFAGAALVAGLFAARRRRR